MSLFFNRNVIAPCVLKLAPISPSWILALCITVYRRAQKIHYSTTDDTYYSPPHALIKNQALMR